MTSILLNVLIIALKNGIKRRIKLASRATANLLKQSVFPHCGPVKRLARVLGATGNYTRECLLQNIPPPGYDSERAIFPVSDLSASSKL